MQGPWPAKCKPLTAPDAKQKKKELQQQVPVIMPRLLREIWTPVSLPILPALPCRIEEDPGTLCLVYTGIQNFFNPFQTPCPRMEASVNPILMAFLCLRLNF